MTATVNLGTGAALSFQPVQPTARDPFKRVLLSIESDREGETLSCVLIPHHKIGVVIASLQLVEKQLAGEGVRCHDPNGCAMGQQECPHKAICKVVADAPL